MIPIALLATLVFAFGVTAKNSGDALWRAFVLLTAVVIVGQMGGLFPQWEPFLIISAGTVVPVALGFLCKKLVTT